MILPYRRYKTKISWINKDHNTFERRAFVFNLFLVDDWMECENAAEGFNDKIARTAISLKSGEKIKIEVSFKEFDRLMNEFLEEVQLLDDNSSPVHKPKIAKLTYSGMMQSKFAESHGRIATTFMPSGQDPKTMEDAINLCLFSNITPLN